MYLDLQKTFHGLNNAFSKHINESRHIRLVFLPVLFFSVVGCFSINLRLCIAIR